MVLYHGSDHIVKQPLFGKGKADNDYGSGFYTTQDKSKAEDWALTNGDENLAVCNTYTIDESNLNILRLDECGTLAWIVEIVENRGARGEISQLMADKLIDLYKIDTSKADIIIGYRADDSYIDIVDAFLKNEVSLDEVDRLFYKGNLGEQVFIKSEKAFDALSFEEYEYVKPKPHVNDNEIQARMDVSKFLRNRSVSIQLNDFKPFGITARDAVNHLYVYNTDIKYYEMSTLPLQAKSDLINEGEYDENTEEYDEI